MIHVKFRLAVFFRRIDQALHEASNGHELALDGPAVLAEQKMKPDTQAFASSQLSIQTGRDELRDAFARVHRVLDAASARLLQAEIDLHQQPGVIPPEFV